MLIPNSSFHKLWIKYLGDWGGGGWQHISGPSSVFQRLISTYPGLTFHLGFFIPLSKILLLITLTILQTASSHHIEEKTKSTKFSYEHLRSEITFHTNSAVILITHLWTVEPWIWFQFYWNRPNTLYTLGYQKLPIQSHYLVIKWSYFW